MRIGNEESHTGLSQVAALMTTFEHGTSQLHKRIAGHCGLIARQNHLERWRESKTKQEREGIYTRTLQMHVTPYVIRLQVLSFKRGDF